MGAKSSFCGFSATQWNELLTRASGFGCMPATESDGARHPRLEVLYSFACPKKAQGAENIFSP